jgi:hypothetical protein
MDSEVQTFANTADQSGHDGYALKYASGYAVVCAAITDQPLGICTRGGTVAKGQTEICVFGRVRAICGGTITKGQMITSHTDGTIVASAGSGCTEFGMALESGVAGDWIMVFVYGGHKQWA